MTDLERYALENMLLKVDNDTRWYELFGTPERAARTLEAHMRKCRSADVTLCDSCVMRYSCEEEQALLEWLRGDA